MQSAGGVPCTSNIKESPKEPSYLIPLFHDIFLLRLNELYCLTIKVTILDMTVARKGGIYNLPIRTSSTRTRPMSNDMSNLVS
jgi:hypothetical protein